MRFLLRMAFWLGIVLVLLPSGGSHPAPSVKFSAADAISAAGATVDDVKQFCGRQTDACSVGSQVLVALGRRAQAGAKMLYEFLNEQLASDTGDSQKSAIPEPVPVPAVRPSQHTLSPRDLAPAWRGPQPQREARRDRPA